MIDYNGRELNIGDRVILASDYSVGVDSRCKVLGFDHNTEELIISRSVNIEENFANLVASIFLKPVKGLTDDEILDMLGVSTDKVKSGMVVGVSL